MTDDETPLERLRRVTHSTHTIRVSGWAARQLEATRLRLEREIEQNPSAYPGYAGRRVTISDTILLLCERAIG